MAKALFALVEAEAARPLGFWGKISLVALPLSALLLKGAFYGQFVIILILTYALYLSSLGLGVVAITRKGTNRIVPFILLVLTLYWDGEVVLGVTRILGMVLLDLVTLILKSLRSVGH